MTCSGGATQISNDMGVPALFLSASYSYRTMDLDGNTERDRHNSQSTMEMTLSPRPHLCIPSVGASVSYLLPTISELCSSSSCCCCAVGKFLIVLCPTIVMLLPLPHHSRRYCCTPGGLGSGSSSSSGGIHSSSSGSSSSCRGRGSCRGSCNGSGSGTLI